MLNFTIEKNEITGHVEGTTEQIITEYALLTYSLWDKINADTGLLLEDFLELICDTTKEIPNSFSITNKEFEDNSYDIVEKTGVLQ